MPHGQKVDWHYLNSTYLYTRMITDSWSHEYWRLTFWLLHTYRTGVASVRRERGEQDRKRESFIKKKKGNEQISRDFKTLAGCNLPTLDSNWQGSAPKTKASVPWRRKHMNTPNSLRIFFLIFYRVSLQSDTYFQLMIRAAVVFLKW